MRKHIYVNSSNLNYIPEIDRDNNFEAVYNYLPHEYVEISPNEWGRIKTDSLYIHFIMGHVRDKNCPWCGSEVKLTQLNKENYSDPFHRLQFCMQCTKCGSRGPIIFIHQSSLIKKDLEDWIKNKIEVEYSYRKSWDETEEFNAKYGE